MKIEREVLVEFEDKKTSIVPSKLIKDVRPGLEAGEMVEVMWEGHYLPCKIIRLSGKCTYLQRFLSYLC